MKSWKIWGVATLSLLFSIPLQACDLCSFYLGLNPAYNRNQVGIRSRYSYFSGAHSHGETATGGLEQEVFRRHECWAQFYPEPTLRVVMSLPYISNKAWATDEPLRRANGIGDPVISLYKQVWQRAPEGAATGHRLFAGLGLSLPFGRWKPAEGTTYEPDFLPGTGTGNALLSVNHLMLHDRIGLGSEVNFRSGGENKLRYRFAARINAQSNLYYRFGEGNISIMPFGGFYAEYAGRDRSMDNTQEGTGGFATLFNSGIEGYFGDFSLRLMAAVPVVSRLRGSQPSPDGRLQVALFYSL